LNALSEIISRLIAFCCVLSSIYPA